MASRWEALGIFTMASNWLQANWEQAVCLVSVDTPWAHGRHGHPPLKNPNFCWVTVSALHSVREVCMPHGLGVHLGCLDGLATPQRSHAPNLLNAPGPAVRHVMLLMQVLGSPHNKGRRSWYQREGRDGKLWSHLDYLVFFLRCV